MAREYVLSLDDRRATLEAVGGKGASLARLLRAGMPVPGGFHLTTAAYERFVAENDLESGIRDALEKVDASKPGTLESASEEIEALFLRARMPEEISEAITAAYAGLYGDEPAVAVRSSATAEDLPEASFAGQQQTFLNVRGEERLKEAVKRCWASLWTARAIGYRERQDVASETVSLAVVVQRMVPADAAGVMFTANPANGRREQAVVSAAWGLGESVVGGSVTPDAIVVEKGSGHVLSREIGDKEVMTVRTESGTEERPVPEARRREAVLDDGAAAELARYGVRIEENYGAPQDIEWALADGEFFILQSRPITALPEPRLEPPSDWSVPDPKGFYARGSIVELLPDPLSPLFADLSEAAVPQSLEALGNEILGTDLFREGEIEFPTINGYAYYQMQLTLRFIRTMLLQSLVRMPEIIRDGPKRWREEFHPRYAASVERWEARAVEDMTAGELFSGANELLGAAARYYTGVQLVIPPAVTSETLFTRFYDRLVKREGDPPAQTYLLGFDSTPIRAEKSLYDLAAWCRERPKLAGALAEVPSDRTLDLLRADRPPTGVDETTWREWRSRFQEHLDRYGHAVYNLDFVNPVPADDPAPLFDTLKFYIRGEGANPHERQRRAATRREQATGTVLARLDVLRRGIFRRLLGWAQNTAPVREDALADTGLGWPMTRKMLLELGRRLVEAGAMENPAGVFWLKRDELRSVAAALDAGQTRIASFADTIEHRKMAWRGQKQATPPQLLPRGKRLLGFDLEKYMPAATDEQTGDTVKGVGASGGQVTATARVLGSPEDFGRMRPGDVLVASITTPAWTPLFAMASAIVTDIGGPLSHSSIVAREYDIPAVLGTGVATRRIRSGQTIRVDGDAGTITLLDGTDGAAAERPSPEPESGTRGLSGAKTVALLALVAGAVVGVAVWWRNRRQG